MPKWAGNPGVYVVDRWCYCDEMIDDACAAAPAWIQSAIPEIRKSAKAEFAAIWARREELYRKNGLAQAQERADEICELQVPHIKLIESTDSPEPIVVAAKLDLAISRFDLQHHLSDVPQGYICDAMRGLLPHLPDDMREKMAPIAAADDKVKNVYWPRPASVPKTV